LEQAVRLGWAWPVNAVAITVAASRPRNWRNEERSRGSKKGRAVRDGDGAGAWTTKRAWNMRDMSSCSCTPPNHTAIQAPLEIMERHAAKNAGYAAQNRPRDAAGRHKHSTIRSLCLAMTNPQPSERQRAEAEGRQGRPG